MEIVQFCKGSKKLAVKYRYYTRYYVRIALCIAAPIALLLLDYLNVFKVRSLKISSFIIALIFIAWLVVLIAGFVGCGSVTALRYQIFGITKDNRVVHFWFKDMLRDGKVVLHFSPYHKKETKEEFIEVVKKKEEVIKDENFEEYLCTLYNDEGVQKTSDILFENMENIHVLKETRKYIVVGYTIGKLGTQKKLKIHKNLTNLDKLLSVIGE